MDVDKRNQYIIGGVCVMSLVLAGWLAWHNKEPTAFLTIASTALGSLCPSAVNPSTK